MRETVENLSAPLPKRLFQSGRFWKSKGKISENLWRLVDNFFGKTFIVSLFSDFIPVFFENSLMIRKISVEKTLSFSCFSKNIVSFSGCSQIFRFRFPRPKKLFPCGYALKSTHKKVIFERVFHIVFHTCRKLGGKTRNKRGIFALCAKRKVVLFREKAPKKLSQGLWPYNPFFNSLSSSAKTGSDLTWREIFW